MLSSRTIRDESIGAVTVSVQTCMLAQFPGSQFVINYRINSFRKRLQLLYAHTSYPTFTKQ